MKLEDTQSPAPGPQFQQLICLRNDDQKLADISPALKVNCRNHPRTDHRFFVGCWSLCERWLFSSETNIHPKQWDAAARATPHVTLGLGRPARVLHGQRIGDQVFSPQGWSAQVLFLGKPSRSVAKMKGFPNKNCPNFSAQVIFLLKV